MKELSNTTLLDERSQYLSILDSLSRSAISTPSEIKQFVETYKLYVETFKKQYGVLGFVDVLDQIKYYPNLDTWFWRMFLVAWKQLSTIEKMDIVLKAPSITRFKWLFETDVSELMIRKNFPDPFVPKSVAIAVASSVTKKFDPNEVRTLSAKHYDFVWVDYNFNMDEYEHINRHDHGWGIIEHSLNQWKLPEPESRQEQFLRLLKILISFDRDIKTELLDRFESFSEEKLQRYIENFTKEIKAVYLMELRQQNGSIADKIIKQQEEWKAIMTW